MCKWKYLCCGGVLELEEVWERMEMPEGRGRCRNDTVGRYENSKERRRRGCWKVAGGRSHCAWKNLAGFLAPSPGRDPLKLRKGFSATGQGIHHNIVDALTTCS